MIYDLCLVYPQELIPFPASYECDEADPKPWNALLFVDKAISKEAAIVFYGKNTWRLSDSAAPTANLSRENVPRLWTCHLRSMRHITIALDGRVIEPNELWELGTNMFEDGGYSHSDKERHQDIHRELLELLEDKWVKKLGELEDIGGKLKSLTVDLSNAYCPTGHCRPIELIIELLNEHIPDPDNLVNQAAMLTGMVTAEEASHAHAAGYLCESCVIPRGGEDHEHHEVNEVDEDNDGEDNEDDEEDSEDNVDDESDEDDGVDDPYCNRSLPSEYDNMG